MPMRYQSEQQCARRSGLVPNLPLYRTLLLMVSKANSQLSVAVAQVSYPGSCLFVGS